MRISREEEFDPEKFPWSSEAAKTIKKIRSARKMKELNEFFCEYFGTTVPSAESIDMMVSRMPEHILNGCGLDKDGHKKKTKKFEVFVRVEGVVKYDAEAETPEGAARKVYADLNDGDPIIYLLRSELDLIKPVAYNDENGDTKDYPDDFDVEEGA